MDIDNMLSELGRSDPFPIDWKAYEASLLRKLAAAEARRRRTAWRFSLIGLAAGVAATIAVMALSRNDVHPDLPRTAIANADNSPLVQVAAVADIPAETRFYTRTSGGGLIRATLEKDANAPDVPNETVQSFVRKTADNKGEIRFSGFSASDAAESGYIAVTKTNKKAKIDGSSIIH